MKSAATSIILLFTIVYIVPLGVRPLVIPDETRYAEISREMLATGGWIVPKIDGMRYFEKPVLGYWLNTAAISLFGENAFAIRLPSALATGISALLVFFMVRKFGGGGPAALLTAAAFLTCFEIFVIGTFCVLDSVFSMFVTATFVFFFFAWQESASLHKKSVFLVLAGMCCGLAFLTKGFIAFVLPVVVIIAFLLWERRWKELLRIWWVPLIVAVLVALPWCLAVHLRERDFWHFFFWHEHIQRFLNAEGGQHPGPFWYFIPVILAGALPWSTWLPNAFSGLKTVKFKDPFIRFTVCWLLFPFLFFSASGGKLATYILPCFPPFAILIVMGFLKWYVLPGKEKAFTVNLYISAIIILMVAFAMVFAQMGPVAIIKIYNTGETWKWVLLVIALLAYAAFLVFAGRQKIMNKQLIYCCLAPLMVLFCVHFVIPDKFKTAKMPENFLLQNSGRIRPDSILVSDNYLMPAVCWVYRRDNIYLLGRAGEFAYGLSYNGQEHKLIAVEKFSDFVRENSKHNKVVLITTKRLYDDYRKVLPSPDNEVVDCGFVMVEFAGHM
ncbi:MAG: phospholipid carrier-dependent glycosyltransferase [Sedimentisphaerales bacterium]